MTKVEHTKTITNYEEGIVKTTALVTDAELVLVEKEFGNLEDGYIKIGKYEPKLVKPILISRTEEVKKGDKYLDTLTGLILTYSGINYPYPNGKTILQSVEGTTSPISCSFKILALPEHFSQQTLQDIVDGELKEGDRVLIECIEVNQDYRHNQGHITTIKLNTHITIYPVEKTVVGNDGFMFDANSTYPAKEKMYTREEVRNIIELHLDHIESSSLLTTDQWFEQTVK